MTDQPIQPKADKLAGSIEEVTIRGFDRILSGLMDLYNVLLCVGLVKQGDEDSDSAEIRELKEQLIIAFEELIERLADTDEEFSWYFKDMIQTLSPMLRAEMDSVSVKIGRFMNAPNN